MPTLTDMIGRTVALGEPFIKLIADYEYTGNYECNPVSGRQLHALAEECLKQFPLLDGDSAAFNKERRIIRRGFVREYGRSILRKLFIFNLELHFETVMKGLTNECGSEDVLDALEQTEMLILIFEAQRLNAGAEGIQLVIEIGEDWKLTFFVEGGGNMFGVFGTA